MCSFSSGLQLSVVSDYAWLIEIISLVQAGPLIPAISSPLVTTYAAPFGLHADNSAHMCVGICKQKASLSLLRR